MTKFLRLLFCLLATPAMAAVFSDTQDRFHDPRFTVTAEDQLRMLAPIGHAATTEPVLLPNTGDTPETEGKTGMTQGTAFMVAPCIALTNYHVVFGRSLEPPGAAQKPYKAKLTIGTETAVGVPFIWGEFAQGPANDWAALRVTPCIGRTTGWLPITYIKDQLPHVVSIFGFYGDQDYSVLAGQDCVLMERIIAGRIWKTNCAVMPGASGSPLGIFKDGVFQPTAIAFAMVRHRSETITYDPQDANVALDLFQISLGAPSLGRAIADDIKAFGGANPAKLPPGYQPKEPPGPRKPITPAAASLPPAPEDVGLPPTPHDIGLPPTPKNIGLPPDPKLLEQ